MFRRLWKTITEAIVDFFKNSPINQLFIALSVFAVLSAAIFGIISYRYQIPGRHSVYGFTSDFSSYWDLSSNILAGRGFVYDAGDVPFGLPAVSFPTYLHQRLPGYSIILAIERKFLGLELPFKISGLSLLMVGFNCFVVLHLLKRFYNPDDRRIYVLSGVILSFPPTVLIYANGINSDFFTASLLLYFYYFFTSSGKKRWASLLFCVLVVFARSNVLVFIAPFIIFSILQTQTTRRYLLAGVALCVVLSVSLWSYRNYKLSGYFSLTSMNGIGALRVNYLLPNIWHPNSFSRTIQSSNLKDKRVIAGIISDHAGELGGGMDFDNFEKDVLNILTASDRKNWDDIYSKFKKEKITNQLYYARWNSLSFINNYFDKLRAEKNVYYAAFRIDDEIKKDVYKFMLENKLVVFKTLLYRIPALLAYDGYTYGLLGYLSDVKLTTSYFALLLLGFYVVLFYIFPILFLFFHAYRKLTQKTRGDDEAVLAYSCIAYFFLTLLVLGVTARYLVPIYYFALIFFIFYINRLIALSKSLKRLI